MKTILRYAAVLAVLLIANYSAKASHAVTYALNPLLFNIDGGGASGAITTDGTQGVLAAGDIIDWKITIFDALGHTFELTGPLSGGNSYLDYTAQYDDLTVMGRNLFWAFSAANGQHFQIVGNSDPPCLCLFVLSTDQVFIDLYDSNQFTLQDYTLPNTDLVATATPLSATFPFFATGLGGLGLLGWGRKRKAQAVA